MDTSVGPAELILILVVFLGIMLLLLLPSIFYLLTLQKALSRCRPENRLMQPGLVWLNIIPMVSLVWHFFTVIYIAGTLEKEFAERRIPIEPQPGQSLGLATSILNAINLIPYVNALSGLGALVCWIIYWAKLPIILGN